MRTIILNAVVLRPGLMALAEERTWQDLRAALAAATEVLSFVGHPETATLLGVAPNRGEYVPVDGDVAWVVRLKRRAAQVGEVKVGPEDLEVLRVGYMSPARLAVHLQMDGWPGSEESLARLFLPG